MELKLPAYLRYVFLLIGLALTIWFLQLFKAVLVPILFSALFAFLLLPLCRSLEKFKVPRPLAILICIITIMLVLGGIIWFLSAQLMSFTGELNNITGKLSELLMRVQLFLQEKFGIEPRNNAELIRSSLGNLQERGTQIIGNTISTTTGALAVFGLIPIYIFCMLYYRNHMRQFMFKFVTPNSRIHVMDTVGTIQGVVASYITGLITVIIIVSMLNSLGLLIMGVKYAFFFGVFAAILTIIPYIGILIGATLPALFTLVETGSVVDALIVVGIFAFVQFLEGNFITPYITGSKVSINPFAAIVALIVGGEIWGAVGMILSIPIIAILKVLFDAYAPTEPLGFLLGDIHDPTEGPGILNKFILKIRRLLGLEAKPDKNNNQQS
ncbi:AI-2E family transporter [Adhaeribacter soli]|uniref:AI-2E family transporter n=1 Tax=Adhaeribacter soli TaxID=2607655 RepID=A0A5N1IXU1_9BACT|nr:AI-2E family transporter [Adhaeribacter soli]KAA9332873.1 AI-2E family transporter [Adhaeribacter soli]